jgi:hypothetical protein
MRKLASVALVLAALFVLSPAAHADPDNETYVAGSADWVMALTADTAGNIWIGSEDTGVACLTPGGGLENFSTENGLGDNNGYALACDPKGRVWVGHLNHGVSVFNGKDWKNYDTPSGPLGQRVYAIAISPKDGDVWIGTDAGITRYSQAKDTWTHFTRADGLPADQVRGIAVDSSGDLYLATATDGVVIGRAADNFAKWEQIQGPPEMPLTVRGKGLPTNLTNGIVVTKDGHIWVSTTRGIAFSNDQGKSFRYTRGRDWPDLVDGSYAGRPEKWPFRGETDLVQDWTTTIATDASGDVWVGFRGRGWQRLHAGKFPVEAVAANFDDHGTRNTIDEPVAILTTTGKTAYVGRYGRGVWRCDMAGAAIDGKPTENLDPAPLPKPAPALTADELGKLAKNLSALPKATTPYAVYLGEDWATQGDWVGRYGRQHTQVCGFFGGRQSGDGAGYSANFVTGPHHPNANVFGAIAGYNVKDIHSLWDLNRGSRTQSEFNDGSFTVGNFPFTVEGPDLWVSFTVPEGPHRVSLYFYSSDNHKGNNSFRDFPLELKKDTNAVAGGAAKPKGPDDDDEDPRVGRTTGNEKMFAMEKTPALARARVNRYWGGVYENFLVNGRGTYWIKIDRNHSFCTKVQGIFIDRLGGPATDKPREDPAAARMGLVDISIPAAPAANGASAVELAARDLCERLDDSWDKAGIEKVAYPYRLAAFRAATENKSSPALLTAWRWPLHLWMDSDREDFKTRVEEGWKKNKQLHPELGANE